MEQTYKIGEAATMLNLKTYVLRFWETEFPQIAPLRTEKGQRLYTQKDLDLLRRIRFLLHEQGLTIDGARRALAGDAARQIRLQGAPLHTDVTTAAPLIPASSPAQEILMLLKEEPQAVSTASPVSKAPENTLRSAPLPPEKQGKNSNPQASAQQLPKESLGGLIGELEEVAGILRGFTTPWKLLQ